MKNMKITVILLISVLILALSGCGGMASTTDNVGIDLSGVIARTLDTSITTVRVWLVADGTNNFFELEQSEFTLSSSNTITLNNIPVGPVYKIYMSLGTGIGDSFTAMQTANGSIVLAGSGENTSDPITASALKTTNPTLTGKNIKGIVYDSVDTYAIDSTNLYKNGIAASGSPVSGYTLNDIDIGINGDIFLSANDQNTGLAIVKYDGSTLDPTYSTGLPMHVDISAPINILSSEIFYTPNGDHTDLLDYQAIISQLDAGFIINVYNEPDGQTNTWTPIDINELLSGAGDEAPSLDLAGELIRGIAVVQKSSDKVWVYLASKLGNFRKEVSLTGEIPSLDFGQDFISGSTALKDKLILSFDYIKRGETDYLFIATNKGLYSSIIQTSSDLTEPPITNETEITATTGERIEMLNAGDLYTACVTALNLIIVKGDEVAKIAFNEGLPTDGYLNGTTGITGLEWKDASTLLVSGYNGIVEVNVSTLF
jgi:hypothetical protein